MKLNGKRHPSLPVEQLFVKPYGLKKDDGPRGTQFRRANDKVRVYAL